MLQKLTAILALSLACTGCSRAGFLYSSASGGYSNEIDYSESKIEWLDDAKPIDTRIAILDFSAGYLRYSQPLGPAFQKKYTVDISSTSTGEAIDQLERATGIKLPHRIASPDPVKIALKGSATASTLLLDIIDRSGMVPTFDAGTLVLTAPAKKP